MLNIQGRLNSLLHSAASAKQFITAQNYMKANTPTAIKERELKGAQDQLEKSQRTVAAYEDFFKKKGRKITGSQRERIEAAIKDQQKKHAAAAGKLFENDPSSENFDILFRGIGSPDLQRRMDARTKLAKKKGVRSIDREDWAKYKKNLENLPTSLGGTVKDLPEQIRKQVQGELIRNGKK